MQANGKSESVGLDLVLERMMNYALQIYRKNKGDETSPEEEEDSLLPMRLKLHLKDALHQLEFSAMLGEYVELIKIPNSLEKLTEYMRHSFTLHENPSSKTGFMEWISLICIIAVACAENGCQEAICIGTQIIKERCGSEERLDKFRRLGCDV